jgi:predicted O-methyltransferase YrrM
MVGVEIGSWVGLSTCIMGLVVKKFHGQLYTVDWYKPTPQQHALESMYKMGIDVKGIFQSNINKFGLGDTVIQYNESSEEASKRFVDNSLDFLFIDGDHTLNGIQTDIRCWFPKVKKDSLIFGHDYIQVKEGLELMNLTVDKKNDIWWMKK